MNLTQEEKNILIQVINQLNLPVIQAEAAVILKGILNKLQEPKDKKD